jgi:hypothetical protein
MRFFKPLYSLPEVSLEWVYVTTDDMSKGYPSDCQHNDEYFIELDPDDVSYLLDEDNYIEIFPTEQEQFLMFL